MKSLQHFLRITTKTKYYKKWLKNNNHLEFKVNKNKNYEINSI